MKKEYWHKAKSFVAQLTLPGVFNEFKSSLPIVTIEFFKKIDINFHGQAVNILGQWTSSIHMKSEESLVCKRKDFYILNNLWLPLEPISSWYEIIRTIWKFASLADFLNMIYSTKIRREEEHQIAWIPTKSKILRSSPCILANSLLSLEEYLEG